MEIAISIDDKVPNDTEGVNLEALGIEVSYILGQLSRTIEIGDFKSGHVFRIFDSNGDPVGEVKISLTVPESPVEA